MELIEANSDGLKHEMKIVVPAKEITERTARRLAEIGRTARVPGFRVGKVPMNLLRKRYKVGVTAEIVDNLLHESTTKAIGEKGLRPAVQPKVDISEFEEGGDLRFTVTVEVMPEIEIPDFSGMALERERVEVTEEILERALQRISEREKRTQPVGELRPTRAGDTLVIDFFGKVGEKPIEGGEGHDFSLTLGSNTFIPGFEDRLVGANVGDRVSFSITFPDQYHADLAGKEAHFDVDVKEMLEPAPSVVDDQLAKSLGLDDLETLRKFMGEQIGETYDGLSRVKLKRKLLDRLSETCSFPVPETMLRMEFDEMWKEIQSAKEKNELDAADRDKSEEDLRDFYLRMAERRIRLGLLLAEVGRQNDVLVTQEDLNRAVVEQARRFPGQEQMVFRYYRESREALETLRPVVFEDKVVDFIIGKAQITDVMVSPEELGREMEDGPEGTSSTEAPPVS
ncbi:MAG: trigger factor [Alphaproteobacteria bacterium]